MNDNDNTYQVDPENIGETKAYVQGYRDATKEAEQAFTSGYKAGFMETVMGLLDGSLDLEQIKKDLFEDKDTQ